MIFQTEEDWKRYLERLEDPEGNDPNEFPCICANARYARNNSGRYEWDRSFVYMDECLEMISREAERAGREKLRDFFKEKREKHEALSRDEEWIP